MRAEHQVHTGACPLHLPGLAVAAFEAFVVARGGLPLHPHIQQVAEEVIAQGARLVGEHAVLAAAMVGAQHPQAADQHGQFRRGQGQQLGFIQQQFLGLDAVTRLGEIAETVSQWLEHSERLDIGLFLGGVDTARAELHVASVAGIFGGLFHSGGTGQHNQVGQRDVLATVVEFTLDLLQCRQHFARALVGWPVLLRRQAQARTVGATALVGTTERRGGRPGGGYQLTDAQSRRQYLALERGNVLLTG
ncbi:hypothetical protein D3C79_725600 [compost metagenome]